jgi:hypothetical protein
MGGASGPRGRKIVRPRVRDVVNKYTGIMKNLQQRVLLRSSVEAYVERAHHIVP